MRREGTVLFRGTKAGTVWQDEDGYGFVYDPGYLQSAKEPVSFTLPLREQAYLSEMMLAFLDGLIPEAVKKIKILSVFSIIPSYFKCCIS